MKFGCVFILLAIVSCSFNARQETLLNKATISYINAFNEKEIMNHVASTHPNCVSFYKDQGDSVFKSKFNLKSDEKISQILQDPTIRSSKFDKKSIHVKYQIFLIENKLSDIAAEKIDLFAISDDEGETWFFMESKDYYNDEVFAQKYRLIRK